MAGAAMECAVAAMDVAIIYEKPEESLEIAESAVHGAAAAVLGLRDEVAESFRSASPTLSVALFCLGLAPRRAHVLLGLLGGLLLLLEMLDDNEGYSAAALAFFKRSTGYSTTGPEGTLVLLSAVSGAMYLFKAYARTITRCAFLVLSPVAVAGCFAAYLYQYNGGIDALLPLMNHEDWDYFKSEWMDLLVIVMVGGMLKRIIWCVAKSANVLEGLVSWAVFVVVPAVYLAEYCASLYPTVLPWAWPDTQGLAELFGIAPRDDEGKDRSAPTLHLDSVLTLHHVRPSFLRTTERRRRRWSRRCRPPTCLDRPGYQRAGSDADLTDTQERLQDGRGQKSRT
jgi:hypothetical protein